MRLLKWAGFAVVGVLAVLALGYGFVFFQTQPRINRTYEVNPGPVQVASPNGNGDSDDGMAKGLAWGEHLAVTRGCVDCHGDDLGGDFFADGMPVFKLSGSNLTPGGVGASYTDQDWVRAIRHGIGPDGIPLLYMPSYEYYYMGDQDLAALIEYLKSLPAVSREMEENEVGPLGRVLFLAGELPLVSAEMIDHGAPRPVAPPRGVSVAYGEYLAVGCTGCHGPGFSGGAIPGVSPEWPEASNITQDQETGIGSWGRTDFFRALTEGKRPDGTELLAEYMPWPNFAQFEADELEALWMYLTTLEARPFGER